MVLTCKSCFILAAISAAVVVLAIPTDPYCPCKPSVDVTQSIINQQRLLCFEDTESARKMFAPLSPQALNLNYRLMQDDFDDRENSSTKSMRYTTDECDVVMKISSGTRIRQAKNERCPGICKVIPFVLVPVEFLLAVLELRSATYSMCTLRLTTNYDDGRVFDKHLSLGIVLRSIASRRLQECEELNDPAMSTWDYVPSNTSETVDYMSLKNRAFRTHERLLLYTSHTKRAAYGLALWVGSVGRIKLARSQASVLRLQDKQFDDSKRILGWVATEDVYTCGHARKNCRPKHGDTYHRHMPHTVSHKATTEHGWACAQRRPLRAIAHVLRLYDVDFMIVVDDDTFVNMNLLSYGSVLSSYILNSMRTEQIVLGDMRYAQVTARGFFFGGAGYLLGRATMENLTSTVITARKGEDRDSYRGAEMINRLGVLNDAITDSSTTCPECVVLRPDVQDQYKTADLGVRVVDLCVNMMAELGTCYHSDHSLTRCLSHAIYASCQSAGCGGTKVTAGDGTQQLVSMCYDGKKCDTTTGLTCHRFMADPFDPARPPLSTASLALSSPDQFYQR